MTGTQFALAFAAGVVLFLVICVIYLLVTPLRGSRNAD